MKLLEKLRGKQPPLPPALEHIIHMELELDERNRHSPPFEIEPYDETPCPDGPGTHVWSRVYSLRVEHVDPKERA